MGYRLNRLDEPIFMAVLKPMHTEFGIHYILESCVLFQKRLVVKKHREAQNASLLPGK